MKFTLWQQFSSNHSSSYTVVGEFQSLDAAQDAAELIRRIMQEAAKWCVEHHEECYQLRAPTPIEKQYAVQYGFDWKERIDWLTYSHEQAIHSVDRLVVINTRQVDTWQTGHQFANLLNAVGAKVTREVMGGVDPDKQIEGVDLHGQGNMWMGMGFELQCDAGTSEHAERLATTLRTIFEQLRRSSELNDPIPWLVFHPQLSELTSEKIAELERNYLKDEKQVRVIRAVLAFLSYKVVHRLWNKVRTLPHDQWVSIGERRRELRIYAMVQQEENRLVFENVSFADIPIGLPVFIRYLEHLGCSNIGYTIRQYY